MIHLSLRSMTWTKRRSRWWQCHPPAVSRSLPGRLLFNSGAHRQREGGKVGRDAEPNGRRREGKRSGKGPKRPSPLSWFSCKSSALLTRWLTELLSAYQHAVILKNSYNKYLKHLTLYFRVKDWQLRSWSIEERNNGKRWQRRKSSLTSSEVKGTSRTSSLA